MHGSILLRRLTAWVMLGLYGLVASGLPLPLPAPPAAGSAAATKLAAKDRSRPFPCMDKPCGCATAEQCFTNCCCHTPAERLAWARARGLEPAVLAALERRAIAAEPVPAAGSCRAAEGARPAGCCAAKPAKPAGPSCCDEPMKPSGCQEPPPACCGTGDERPARQEEAPSSDAPPAPAGRGLVLRAMLACGGMADALSGTALGGSLPPPRVEFSPSTGLRQVAACIDEADERLPSEPTDPPPRLG